MVLSLIGAGLLLLGTVAVVTGLIPLPELLVLVDRVAPILVFVVAMTVVTELCSEAGVFRWIARRLRHWGGGRAWLLWLWVAGIAIVTTVFLSLDTTAVLLTPVVVVVARQAGLPPLPFALTTVWLANTGSLLLPISNLTNLLAQNRLGGISPIAFAGLTAAPARVAVIVPMALVALIFRKDLGKRYSSVPVQRMRVAGTSGAVASIDRVLLGTTARIRPLRTTARIRPLRTTARIRPLGTTARIRPLGTTARIRPLRTTARPRFRRTCASTRSMVARTRPTVRRVRRTTVRTRIRGTTARRLRRAPVPNEFDGDFGFSIRGNAPEPVQNRKTPSNWFGHAPVTQ